MKKAFEEIASGKNMKRPRLNEMIDFARKGGTIIVESYSRISRSITDLLSIIERLKKKQVNFKSIKENFDLTTPSGNLTFNVLASIGQYEREILLERQMEGIKIAKAAGKYKGRTFVKVPENFYSCLEKYNTATRDKKYSITDFMLETKLKKSTLLRMIKEHQNNSMVEQRGNIGKKK
jgi:DNA invertase Pin-like site-specific DNA recombinase